ncbi:hypothetical protein HK103_003931 [Boothiomyces macroporosus]|uniref:Phosphopantothenate-cysteine ligase n=1 Tax=Boothiomyces macroporosus TaxID=261099 RepID=A0AAD5US26_9FUNG|nr:hypothetical protein HK103_003931 [Boothiomyces macroporosus]
MQSQETTPDEYFTSTTPPANLKAIAGKVQTFIDLNQKKNKKIVLITSVPLENQTVRFLDNFSAGTRGATSAEHFIEAGYAVIFLHRQYSLEPYTRHYTHSTNCFLDLLEVDNNDIKVTKDHKDELRAIIEKYNRAKNESLLLKINFTTVSEYLFLLKEFTLLLDQVKDMAVEHKIQSSGGGLSLVLDQVPKIIKPLVKEWAPSAFTVSFKLETDSTLLVSKSKSALEKYGHQIVIGNMLHTRKHVVWFIGREFEKEVRLTQDEIKHEVEIEKYIIAELIKLHDKWISTRAI